ncbi:MAG: hypothetical protein PHP08_02570 [Candidatus Dojkabacteria bacterium]|nr:hypothetical protein [Candidatus Dojkabacteria bacterium]
MVERTLEKDDIEIPYQELSVGSFEEAGYRIIEVDEVEKTPRFLLLDLDGTLFPNIMKYPFISVLIEPKMKKETEESFKSLIRIFDSRFAIATNRNEWEKIFWNSADMLIYVEKFVSKEQIYESMQKQTPFFFPKKIEELVNYIAGSIFNLYGEDCRFVNLDSIEDKSFVSFNRKGFLNSIAKRMYDKHNIRVEINNYVIKKKYGENIS